MSEVTYSYLDHIKGRIGEMRYRKKPIEIEAYQINEDFYVKTMEGTMKGKAGDYVIQGIRNELYVCNQEIFNETYEFVQNIQ